MSSEAFKKKDNKVIKSFGLSKEAIDKLEGLYVKHQVSRSQIIEDMLTFSFAENVLPHSFELALKAQVKGRPRFTQSGRAYTDENTKKYETRVKTSLRQWWTEAPIKGPIKCRIEFQFTAPVKSSTGFPSSSDIDNLIKAWFDGANGVVWTDDRQVVEVISTKSFGVDDRIKFMFGPGEVSEQFEKKKAGYKWIG